METRGAGWHLANLEWGEGHGEMWKWVNVLESALSLTERCSGSLSTRVWQAPPELSPSFPLVRAAALPGVEA